MGFTRCGVKSSSYNRTVTVFNTFKCNGNLILPPNKQDGQCTYHVILRGDRANTVAVEK